MTILWVGGPAAAGKTTVSRLFARMHGYIWYSVDAHAFTHEARAIEAGLHQPDTGPGTFDRTPMILEDIRAFPANAPVIVEGAFVTPTMAGTARNALWLMPSKPEQQARLEVRNPGINHEGLIWGWQLIHDQLSGTQATILTVDNQSIPQTLAAVEQHFAPFLTTNPDTPTRQSYLRLSNTELATQSRQPTTTFDCECGTPTCTASVETSPADLPSGRPLLAPPHTTRARQPNPPTEVHGG
ncbi:hypothetical protein ACFV9C_35705 [Kribbella sp. NPDC059898]|uniref:AAA family ATPase n=1 Tax=Kribbella sp. NPDC059898 TaxID=3346995 RepID=UPI0036666BDC